MPSRQSSKERRERTAQIQAQQRRAERRRTLLILGPAIVVALALVGSVVFAIRGQQRTQDQAAERAKKPISGVRDFGELSRNHVTTTVDYPQTPAVGGDHAPVWANCAVYSKPLDPGQAVHSLEHGAVWIGYDPALAKGEVAKLSRFAPPSSYVLVSPVSGMSTPVTAVAWGKQLTVKTADDPRLAAFVAKYEQGPQTPEPGAACTGGAGGM